MLLLDCWLHSGVIVRLAVCFIFSIKSQRPWRLTKGNAEMRNMSKKTRKLLIPQIEQRYWWFDYWEGSVFYHSNHVWPARLWIGDAIDIRDDTQCWMYIPVHKNYIQAITIARKDKPIPPKVAAWIDRRRKEFGSEKGGLRKNYVKKNR